MQEQTTNRPTAERILENRAPTFEECMSDFLAEYVRSWLDAHEHAPSLEA